VSDNIPLKEHIDELARLHAKMEEERFASQKELSDQRFAAQEKAIEVAEANAEKWRMNANEWRAAMTDRERNFLSKGMGYVVGALSAVALILTIVAHVK